MSTLYLCSAGDADTRLAAEFESALPKYARRAGGDVSVTRTGDPAEADWFLLIASPESAVEAAVDRAVRARVEGRGVQNLQVVVSAGEWWWDQQRDVLDEVRSTAAPAALHDAFGKEPRHLVYRGDRQRDVSLRNLLFAEQVAEVVAPIVGVTKDEIFGEEVSAQQRTRRLSIGTGGLLAVLAVGAVVGTFLAVVAANAADAERARAQAERDAADSRRLASQAAQVASGDGALARLLAVQAYEISPTDEAATALEEAAKTRGAWEVETTSEDVRRLIGHDRFAADIAMSAEQVATVDLNGRLRFWDLDSSGSPLEGPIANALSIAFSGSGELLAAASGRGVELYDASGTPIDVIEVDGTPRLVAGWGEDGFVVSSTVPNGESVSLVTADGGGPSTQQLGLMGNIDFVGGSADGQRVLVGTTEGEVLILDTELAEQSRWQLVAAADQLGERDSLSVLAWDGDERVIMPPDNNEILGPTLGPGGPDPGNGAIAGLYEAGTGKAIEPITVDESLFPLPATAAAFRPDGSALAVSPGGLEAPPRIGTTAADIPVDEVPMPPEASRLAVSPDGAWLAVSGTDEAVNLVRIGESDETDDSASSASGTPAAQLDAACEAAGRNLSEAEWAIYLPDREQAATCDAYDSPHAVRPPRLGAGEGDVEPSDEATTEEPSDPEPPADPFADVDLANQRYDVSCLVGPQGDTLVDGRGTDDSFSILELVDDSREDRNGDGVPDAVLNFECSGASSLTRTELVLDGTRPDELIVIDRTSELLQ